MTFPVQLTTPVSPPSRPPEPRHAAQLPLRGGQTIQSVYIHVPFCFHKCHYCDFYSIVDSQDRQGAFVARLIEEMKASSPWLTAPVQTIFIGGGTPTLLSAELWKSQLLPAIREHIPIESGAEISVEANPETVTAELAEVLMAGGVNRISIGAQSFDPRHLKMLERWHDPANVERSVGVLRAAGFSNINLDLIFAIPGQSPEDWRRDLERALAIMPQHLSCYGLTYEPNTAMTARLKKGQFARADEDLEAQMYEETLDALAAAGLEQYEISNWSLPGRRCRHNMMYWLNANWWPLGPGAAGHVAGVRWKNVPRLGEYLDHGPLPPITGAEALSEDQRIGEELMLRLRLIEGLPEARLGQLVGEGDNARRRAIDLNARLGLLELQDGRIRLTRRGLLVADAILSDLI